MEKVEIRGYTDPRTGEYKRATEANREEAAADLGFILAWKFYWDGPRSAEVWENDPFNGPRIVQRSGHLYDRETWLICDDRAAWTASLSQEQRDMLADCPPPEEVPGFAS